jgi:hypothetical protein
MDKRRLCSTSNLDYDRIPPIQGVIEEMQYIEYPCLTNSLLDPGVPLEFRIDKSNTATDLGGIYLNFSASVVNADGTSLADDAVISTVNNFGYSLFSGVDVYIQDQKVSTSQGYYPFAAYLKMLLFTTDHEKEYYLRQALWRRDAPGFMDRIGVDKAGVKNPGFVERAAYIAKSSTVNLLVKLVFDFTIQSLIPEQTEIFLRLHRSKASLCLLAKSGDYKVKISNARLYVPRYKLSSLGNQIIKTRMSRDNLYFSSTKIEVFTKMVGKNDQNFDWTPITGSLPKRIFFFQILNSDYNGSINKNIFNFQCFGIRQIQVHKNGRCLPIAQGINATSNSKALLYTMTLEAVNRPEYISFSEWEFSNGYMVACFDLSNDASAGISDYRNIDDSGTIRIQVDYEKPLDEAITVFCVTERFDVMKIDGQKNPSWT